MKFNPYLVLDVPMSADFELLRATYRRLARENHPDVAPDKLVATERMAQINRAWGILGDEEKRAAFDAQWRTHQAEAARQEAYQRDRAQRESFQREAVRARARRESVGAPPSSKNSNPTPSRAAKKTKRGAGTKSRSQIGGEAAPQPQAARGAAQFEPVSSPRALRLMTKVTLATRVWQRDGNARTAIEMCRAVLLADGRNVPARELLSEIFASQGRLEIAVMMLDQAIQIAPDDLFLRRKRDHLERGRFPAGKARPLARPSLWQRLRARLERKKL